MTLLLDRATIEGLLSMKEAIDLTEQAFRELADQTVDMPQRLVMADAERAGNKLFMPAHMKGIGALGVKAGISGDVGESQNKADPVGCKYGSQ